jgi:hypothetical protein
MAQYETGMKPVRNRSALIWLAVAAIAVGTLIRAQAGLQSAASYAHPVMEYLAAHQGDRAFTDSGSPHRSDWHTRIQGRGGNSGIWVALFPVFFIGLITPLNLALPSSVRCFGRTPSAPVLPSSFQRPPPALQF